MRVISPRFGTPGYSAMSPRSIVRPTSTNPARRKHRPGSRLRRTFPASMNVTIPSVGTAGQRCRVTATASVTSSEERCPDSFRKIVHSHAPCHAKPGLVKRGQDDTHTASASGVRRTTTRPGGVNCAAPTVFRE
jgi:hypothetical protein